VVGRKCFRVVFDAFQLIIALFCSFGVWWRHSAERSQVPPCNGFPLPQHELHATSCLPVQRQADPLQVERCAETACQREDDDVRRRYVDLRLPWQQIYFLQASRLVSLRKQSVAENVRFWMKFKTMNVKLPIFILVFVHLRINVHVTWVSSRLPRKYKNTSQARCSLVHAGDTKEDKHALKRRTVEQTQCSFHCHAEVLHCGGKQKTYRHLKLPPHLWANER